MPDLTPEEIPKAQEIAYFRALARGIGNNPPPYDSKAAVGDFWHAAGEVIARRAPFTIHSVHFDFPGGQAIHLRDPATDKLIGATPEWVIGARNELAAFVRAIRPQIRVVFRATPAADGPYTIGAEGTPIQVDPRYVTLLFNPATGLSAPEMFQASGELPDQIGLHSCSLNWYVREQTAQCMSAGTSTHRIATSWRALATIPAPGEDGLPNWVYGLLMEWTCRWAAGLNDEKAICDAIIANVGSTGLRYGVAVPDVRQMLLSQGGMCGVWYQAFQMMTHCQGIFVYRRRFMVDWRLMPNGEEHWCAIVIRSGGLNQAEPTRPPSAFRDNHTQFPIPVGVSVPIVNVIERRYRFWGLPNFVYDGHCINFLEYNGHLYLYDACFGVGPIQINAPLPVNNTNVAQGGANLAAFKMGYFEGAIDYMLGSIWNGPDFLQSVHMSANGMTVRTTDIPEIVNGGDGLSFRWGN